MKTSHSSSFRSIHAMIQIIRIILNLLFTIMLWIQKCDDSTNYQPFLTLSSILQTSLVCRNSSHPRQNSFQNALWRGNDEWVRKITRPFRAASQLHRERRGEGASGEVLNRQIWNSPDESYPQAIGCGDVAVWWAPEAVWSTSKYIYTVKSTFYRIKANNYHLNLPLGNLYCQKYIPQLFIFNLYNKLSTCLNVTHSCIFNIINIIYRKSISKSLQSLKLINLHKIPVTADKLLSCS